MKLARAITKEQELLKTVKKDTEGIVLTIKKDQVRWLQNKLLEIKGDASIAQLLQDVSCIASHDFLASLDKHINELQSLSRTCDTLCTMVCEAYQLFKSKSGFITQRVLDGNNIY